MAVDIDQISQLLSCIWGSKTHRNQKLLTIHLHNKVLISETAQRDSTLWLMKVHGKIFKLCAGHFHVNCSFMVSFASQRVNLSQIISPTFFLFSFLRPPFGQRLLYHTGNTGNKIFTCTLMGRVQIILQTIVNLMDYLDLLKS